MKLKNVLKKIGFAGAMFITGLGQSFAAPASQNNPALCDLVVKMSGVFNLLSTLAFIGAAFIIAGWAWGFIAAGDVKSDDIKKKGVGLIVGFSLLLGIGFVLKFLISSTGMNMIGCVNQFSNFGLI